MWDDIAILVRYLLMLSFNDCLDGKSSHVDSLQIPHKVYLNVFRTILVYFYVVARHLPYLLYLGGIQVSTDPDD